MSNNTEVFAIPIRDKYLLYAPLHGLLALVNAQALDQIRCALSSDQVSFDTNIQSLVTQLRLENISPPSVRSGSLRHPLLLGILPTRGCNMACRYCDFLAPKHTSPVMKLEVARAAIDGYLRLLSDQNQREGQVHFFGGEPFYAPAVVRFVVDYARERASALGVSIHFEATSNGLYSPSLCEWIAHHFDTIVLSLDGPRLIQDSHRPVINGRGSFDIVARTAKLLSAGKVELIIRSCVTNETVKELPAIASWITQEFRPSTVCFESLTVSPWAQMAGMTPPDPWVFAQNFVQAAKILETHNIRTVLSTAEIDNLRVSFCPVGHDALIVSPNGAIHACYLLEENWREKGLDMTLGHVDVAAGELLVEQAALERVRQLNVYRKPLCAHCFCRYHCAGGCHVNHDTSMPPGQFTNLCLQTRLITIVRLLRQLAQDALVDDWLADSPAMQKAAWQSTDRLFS